MPIQHADGSLTLSAEEVALLNMLVDRLHTMGHPGYLSSSLGSEVRSMSERIREVLSGN